MDTPANLHKNGLAAFLRLAGAKPDSYMRNIQGDERAYDSDNDDYVRFQIRQNDISGSSCTIVLCGARTHERKYVDWEIKATLDKSHGLIGVWLPTLALAPNGGTVKPARLQDNIDSGYAKWVRWGELSVDGWKAAIESAVASPARLIVNSRTMRQRNG